VAVRDQDRRRERARERDEGPIDVDRVAAPCFGLAVDVTAMDSGWHAHARHQLLYAARGSMQLWVDDAQWLLPPGRAAWIPARARHRVAASALQLRTVYLHPRRVPGALRHAVVLAASPLCREMILHAMRFGPSHVPDRTASAFFGALAALCAEWTAAAAPLRLPVARTPELRRAMQWTLSHVAERPRASQAARAAGLSTRTLARRFAEETGTTWRRFLHDARMLEAMRRLGEPGTRVGDVAAALGFQSQGAFTHAFTAFAGETPRRYVARRE
jgi:AraC-like DNA-binding protein/mannose-6-phosphate isomerase-like protein (cupin superfamily)